MKTRNTFRLAKQRLCSCTFFCTFLCCHCASTAWKCLISRFIEEVNNSRRNFLLLLNLDMVGKVRLYWHDIMSLPVFVKCLWYVLRFVQTMLHVLDKACIVRDTHRYFPQASKFWGVEIKTHCSLCIVKLKKHVRVFENVCQIHLFLFQITFLTSPKQFPFAY